MIHVTRKVLLVFAALIAILPAASHAKTSFNVEMQSRIEQLNKAQNYKVLQHDMYGRIFIAQLYQTSNYQPVWDDGLAEVLAEEIRNLRNDGLNPEDYWFAPLDALLADKRRRLTDTSAAADLDMLLTEAFIRAYYNLLVGKADPERLDENFNFSKPLNAENQRPVVIKKLLQGRIREVFNRARPPEHSHSRLRDALAQYRGYEESGGWEPVQPGTTLKPGTRSARVSQVRARLSVTGDYTGKTSSPDLFDAELEQAVRSFQARHGLEIDGAVGADTIEAMNVPVQQRIDQLRVNLERQRWYMHENRDEYIVTDIAGFNVYWIRNNEVIWSTRAQVGKDYSQTPVFKDKLRTIVFNPTWTIPPGIMYRSILPNLKKDPGYLGKKGYLLLTHDGKEVDPLTVDWSKIEKMPYIVRQPAGPNNALGLVKFLFPNKHLVYLHDTNHREHFADASRTFSSGCVRIQNPFDFAELLLADQEDWNREKIDALVKSGETKWVKLEKPIRIIIAYSTASARNGKVYFKEDIYDRDARVLKALDAPFSLRERDIRASVSQSSGAAR